jgi:hypothetical protein
MQGSAFDELGWFAALHRSGGHALLIGRRACVLYGLPLLTADYDLWIAPADVEKVNQASVPFGLSPTLTPEEARRQGLYALENDEHVDVICAATMSTIDGATLAHDVVWQRSQRVDLREATVCVPSIPDLIACKKVRPRAKDLEDIAALEALLAREAP